MTRSPETDMRPGFVRLLMVNTHRMPDRIEELPLESHTAIIAQNQAGKTSILKLIPFFFGAAPARIQTGRNDNKDFYDFYLPMEDSYLALEYRNAHGAVRSVVVYRSTSGKEPRYRLVRGPLNIDMFVEDPLDPESGFIRNADFERNAIDCGHVLHPRLIDTTRAYRAIIQGLRLSDRGQERSDHRGLVEEYGIGRISQPLEDIDELFLTTVENSFTVNDLLGTILRKVTQTGSTRLKLLGGDQADQCRALSDDHSSYRLVMKAEPGFRQAERDELELQELRNEAGRTRSVLLSTVALAAVRSRAAGDEIETAERNHLAGSDARRERLGEITERITFAKNEVSRIRRDISRIRSSREALIGEGAERAADELAAIPALRDRLASVDTQISALNGSRDRIDALFRTETDRLRDRIASESRRLNERHAEILSAGKALSEALRHEIDEALEARIDHHRRHEVTLRSAEKELTGRIDLISDEIAALEPDEALKIRRQRAAEHLSESQAALHTAEDGLKRGRADHEQACKLCSDAEAAVHVAEKRAAGIEAEYVRVSDQLSPAAGSLRKWLDENRPDWRSDIGKLVDERILSMTGLEPELTGPDGDRLLFGVRIDTDQLPDGCAAIEALETRLAELNISLDQARQGCVDLRKAHEATASRRKAARDQMSRAELVHQTAAANRERAAISLKDAEAEAERWLRTRRDALSEARRNLQVERDALGRRITEEAEANRRSVADMRARMETDQADRKAAQSAAEARIKAELADLARGEEDEKGLIESRRLQAMSAEGTDPKTISELQRTGQALRLGIDREAGLHSLLGRWTTFLEDDEPRLAGMAAQLQGAELSIPDGEAALEREKAAARTAEAEHRARVDELRTTRSRLDSLIGLASQEGIEHQGEPDAEPRDPEDIPGMITTLRKARDGEKRLRNEIANAVEEIAQIFLGSRGQVKDYYLGVRGENARDRKDHSNQLRVLGAWYDERHAAIRTSIHERANVQGAPIIAAFDRIRRIERDINQMGTRLRDAIGALPQFRSVRDIDLRIRSRLSEQAFYSDMADYTEAHHRRDMGGHDEDIDGLIRAMSSFFKAWEQNSGAGEIDLLNMVFIEGSFVEGGQSRTLGRNSDIGSLSSTGGASILRQILLAGLVQLIRGKSEVRFTWGVDELGQLDPNNIRGLVEMLSASGITVITGSPDINPVVMSLFEHRITIRALEGGRSSTLLSHNQDNIPRSGIRSWTDAGHLSYPEVI
ncbi:ATP-binding protein [Paracoccus sp. ME4]|uniref:ATP-binding protein n=1 Tax=Paracoccus sp. ME4 TaxID=3138066 RepID=UPI00398B3489